MTDELAVLLQAATKRNISHQPTKAAAEMTDRVQSMNALKGLGFSLADIGLFHNNLTRQRVQQLIGDSRRAEPINREKVDAKSLMMEIWKEELSGRTLGLLPMSTLTETATAMNFSKTVMAR